jgi:hypothetical protein
MKRCPIARPVSTGGAHHEKCLQRTLPQFSWTDGTSCLLGAPSCHPPHRWRLSSAAAQQLPTSSGVAAAPPPGAVCAVHLRNACHSHLLAAWERMHNAARCRWRSHAPRLPRVTQRPFRVIRACCARQTASGPSSRRRQSRVPLRSCCSACEGHTADSTLTPSKASCRRTTQAARAAGVLASAVSAR